MDENGLRFLLDESSSKQLVSRLKALKLPRGAARRTTLRNIYLDTPDHALNKAEIALRLRREGRRWLQVAEGRGSRTDAAPGAADQEVPAPGGRARLDAIPDPGLRDEVLQRVNGTAVVPFGESVIQRSTTEVSLGDGTRVALAIDVGRIRAEGRSAELREAEIALVEGDSGGIFDLARVLFPEGGLAFSQLPLSARAYMLAEEGRIEPTLAARNAGAAGVEPAWIAERAARDCLRDCLGQIATNILVVCRLDDAEGPHQLRVGLRRLRSVFSAYKSALSSPEMARLNGEARWLGKQVGALRDLDVVAGDIVGKEAARHPDEPALAALADALARQAAERRQEVRRLLVGQRSQSFLIDLAQFIETRGWLVPADFEQTARLATPVVKLAVRSLNKRWKKVSKAARGLEMLDAEHRHALRKELKKLRYGVEFFGPLFPERRLDAFLKRLKKLQTVFGDLNDAATMRHLFAGPDAYGAADPAAQRAVGWVIGAGEARAEVSWSHAQDLWRDLDDQRPFWR